MSVEKKLNFLVSEFEMIQEAAFRALQSDVNLILKLSNGSEAFAEEIMGAVTLDISNKNRTFDLASFSQNRTFRLSIYRKKVIDLLRKSDVLGESVRDDSYNGDFSFLEGGESEDGEREKNLLHLEKEIQEYMQDILSDAQELFAERKLERTTLDRMVFIIESRILKKTLKEIGQILGVSESRMSQILREIRKLFPKYEDFWNIIFAKNTTREKNIATAKEKELSLERIQRVIISLLDQENLTNWEKGVLLCAQYYNNSVSYQQLLSGLEQLGIVINNRNMSYLRKNIEQLAGHVHISWALLHTKSKV